MSTIMRALRRLEQEREQKVETERLHGEVVAPSPEPSGWPRLGGDFGRWSALVVMGLVVGGAASWWMLGGSGPSPDAPVASQPIQAPGRTDALPPRRAPPVRSVDRPPAVEPESDPQAASPGAVAVVPVPMGGEPLPSAPPVRRTPRGAEEPGRAEVPKQPEPQVARARKITSLPKVAPIEPTPTPAARPPPVATAPAVRETAAVSATPPVSDTSAGVRGESSATSAPAPKPKSKPKTAPTPKVEPQPAVVASVIPFSVVRTVWHPKPEKRLAQIAPDEGARVNLHEGDVYEGLVVEEIQLTSVIFRDGDVTFSRRVSARRAQP